MRFSTVSRILEAQLGVDGQDVRHRIDAAIDVHDVVVFKAAHDVGDGVDFANRGQKLIAKALALRGAAHEAGYVDEVDRRGDGRLGMVERNQGVEAWVRDLHHADVGFDGAERIVRHGRTCRRERIKKRRLAHVGQADDTA